MWALFCSFNEQMENDVYFLTIWCNLHKKIAMEINESSILLLNIMMIITETKTSITIFPDEICIEKNVSRAFHMRLAFL